MVFYCTYILRENDTALHKCGLMAEALPSRGYPAGRIDYKVGRSRTIFPGGVQSPLCMCVCVSRPSLTNVQTTVQLQLDEQVV